MWVREKREGGVVGGGATFLSCLFLCTHESP